MQVMEVDDFIDDEDHERTVVENQTTTARGILKAITGSGYQNKIVIEEQDRK